MLDISPVPFETQLSQGGKLSHQWTNWLNELRNFIRPKVFGSRSSPVELVAGTALSPAADALEQTHFIQGDGGAVNVSADPQIAPGSRVGQMLRLICCHDTNTVTYEDGTGLILNGTYVMVSNSLLSLVWDGSNWVEEYRNGIA